MLLKLLTAAGLCAFALSAQVKLDNITGFSTSAVDFSGVGTTKPNRAGSALPGTCSAGESFYLNSGSTGLYTCTAPNTWSATKTFSTGTVLPATCSVGRDMFLNTDFFDVYQCTGPDVWELIQKVLSISGDPNTIFPNACNQVEEVGRFIRNTSATTAATSVYICSATGASTYTWKAVFGVGGSSTITDVDNLSLSAPGGIAQANTAYMATHTQIQDNADLYCASSGASSTAYSCDPAQALTQYTAGQVIWWKPDVTSGSTPTINISTKGTKNLKKADGTTPSSGDFVAGQLYALWYDGASFRSAAGGSTSGSPSLSTNASMDLHIGGCHITGGPGPLIDWGVTGGAAGECANGWLDTASRLSFPATGTPYAVYKTSLPSNWNSSQPVSIILTLTQNADSASADLFRPSVDLWCPVNGDNMDAPSFSTAVETEVSQMAIKTMTNTSPMTLTVPGACAADGQLWVRIGRNQTTSGTNSTLNMQVLRAQLKYSIQ